MKSLSHEVDLLVVGGGVAGTVAAIAAARRGLKTVLVQDRPVLGGPSSSECSCNSNGAFINGASEYMNRNARECGVLEEMKLEAFYRRANGWEEHWSLVLREWAEREPNLTLLLNTLACDVTMDGRRITSVTARATMSFGSTFGSIHASIASPGRITGIRSWMNRTPSPGSRVRMVKTGTRIPAISSIRYNPASHVTPEPSGWIIYLSPVLDFPVAGFVRCSHSK